MNSHVSYLPAAGRALLLSVALCLVVVGCKTTAAADGSRDEGSQTPVVTVTPDEGCPDVDEDLTTVVGANLDQQGLLIEVRTTTFCNLHEFSVHACAATERATTYRVSETNDCGLPNDGVVEHVLLIERQHLGEAAGVETFDAETVTVTH